MSAVDRTPKPCVHPRANHRHGTHLAFDKDRCRCEPCEVANRRHDKATRYRTVTGTHTYVDAEPARQHVTQLLEHLTLGQVEQRSGVHRTAIRVLIGAAPGRPASKRITRTTATALLAVRGDRVGPEEHGLVDGTGTRRRLRALVALGWPVRHLQTRARVSSRTTWLLTQPTHDDTLILVSTRETFRRLYDELSLTRPAPSRGVTRARALAAARGWPPPLAWDDETIDDPAASPQLTVDDGDDVIDPIAVDVAVAGERPVTLTRAERFAALERLAAAGLPDRAIADRLGVTERTIERNRRALGIESRWAA